MGLLLGIALIGCLVVFCASISIASIRARSPPQRQYSTSQRVTNHRPKAQAKTPIQSQRRSYASLEGRSPREATQSKVIHTNFSKQTEIFNEVGLKGNDTTSVGVAKRVDEVAIDKDSNVIIERKTLPSATSTQKNNLKSSHPAHKIKKGPGNRRAIQTRIGIRKKKRRFLQEVETEYAAWSQLSEEERGPKKFYQLGILKDHYVPFSQKGEWEGYGLKETGLQWFLHKKYRMIYNFNNITTKGYINPFSMPKTLPSQHSPIPMLNCDYLDIDKEVDHICGEHFSRFDTVRYFDFDPLFRTTLNVVEELFCVFDGLCSQTSLLNEAHSSDYSAHELRSSPGLPFLRYADSKLDCLDWVDNVLEQTYEDIQDAGKKILPSVCFGIEHHVYGSDAAADKLKKKKSKMTTTKGSWVYSAVTSTFERTFTVPIYKEITNPQNWEKSPFKLPYENYYRKMNGSGNFRYCEFEILNLHQNISSYLLRYIFKMIHRWVFNADEINYNSQNYSGHKLFEALRDYFIYTPIILPNGQIIEKVHGAAYGSEFTLLVISIMSSFLGVYCMLNQGFNIDAKEKNIVVLGNSVSMCVPHTFNVLQMIRDIESLGFAVDATTIHLGREHSFETTNEGNGSKDSDYGYTGEYYDDELY